uniref:Uncharacterized protein n=1 Tax=Glossina austeni TaxID=7395 RepID=A0A1A9V218_GLOAU
MYIEVSLKNTDRNNKGNQQFRIIKFCIHCIWINVRIKRNEYNKVLCYGARPGVPHDLMGARQLAANYAVEKSLSLDEISAVQHVCSWLATGYGFDGFAFTHTC